MSGRIAPSTWAWLAVLVLAGAAIAWQAGRPAAPAAHDEEDTPAARLLAVPEANWSAVELLGGTGVQRFERDAAGGWLLHADAAGEAADHSHRSEPASAERIAAAFGTFSRTGVERRLAVPDPTKLAAYGLDRPSLIVVIRGADDRPVLTLEVGQMAPDGLSRYVRLPRDGSVMTIANFQIDGLLALTRPAPAPAASTASAPAR